MRSLPLPRRDKRAASLGVENALLCCVPLLIALLACSICGPLFSYWDCGCSCTKPPQQFCLGGYARWRSEMSIYIAPWTTRSPKRLRPLAAAPSLCLNSLHSFLNQLPINMEPTSAVVNGGERDRSQALKVGTEHRCHVRSCIFIVQLHNCCIPPWVPRTHLQDGCHGSDISWFRRCSPR